MSGSTELILAQPQRLLNSTDPSMSHEPDSKHRRLMVVRCSTFSEQSFEKSLAVQFIENAFVEIFGDVQIHFDGRISLRDNFQSIAQAILRNPRGHRKALGKVIIG